jgi:hypothetical protein
VVAAIAVVGVIAFFLLRDDDDGTVAGSDDTTEVATTLEETTPSGESGSVLTSPDVTGPELTLPSLPDLSIPDLSLPESPGTFAPPGSIPESEQPPDGLGDDADLNDLSGDCYDGSMQACDDLYDDAPAGSQYERYGDTCAGRQPEGTQQYCTASFPS